MPGLARPVRTAPNSSLANSIARSIFSSASKRVSSITWCSASFVGYVVNVRGGRGALRHAGPLAGSASAQRAGGLRGDRGDQGADLLTLDGPDDGVVSLGGEDQHRQPVLLAQAERRGIDHLQPSPQR